MEYMIDVRVERSRRVIFGIDYNEAIQIYQMRDEKIFILPTPLL